MRHPATSPVIPRWSRSLAILIVVLMLWLTGCATGATPESGDSTSGSPTASSTSSSPAAMATSAPQQALVCQNLAGFGSAPTANAGNNFSDVSFPPNAISTTIATSGGGAGRFTIKQFDACAPATTTGAVYAFYTSALASAGWSSATTYPYDTAWQASCGDPYCWKKDHAPRYVSLEKVTSRGNGLVSYHIRLAIPPAGPTCSSSVDIYAGKTWDTGLGNAAGVNAPPLTLEGLGDGYDDSVASHSAIQDECSAGTMTAVNNFFTTELANHGWQHSTPALAMSSACHTTGSQWWKGKDLFAWSPDATANDSAAANTVYWGYNSCHLL